MSKNDSDKKIREVIKLIRKERYKKLKSIKSRSDLYYILGLDFAEDKINEIFFDGAWK